MPGPSALQRAAPPIVRTGGILTLDCGHVFGWAYAFPGDEPVYSHLILPKPNGKGFNIFRDWLIARIVDYQPRLIVYEEPILNHYGPAKTSLQTAQWLIGLYAHVVEIAFIQGVRCEPANVSQIKRFLTLDGKAKKGAMIAAIEACGWHPETSDEADALAILLWAEVQYAPKIRRNAGSFGPLFAG